MLRYLLHIVRNVVRLFEWATGRRHYPWTSSPPHRLFAMIASRAGGWPGAQYRAVHGFATAILKFRERLHGDRVNFGLRLTSPVNAHVLSNTAWWESGVISAGTRSPKWHLNVSVAGDTDAVQLDRFGSLLLASDAIGTINFFFDDDAARDARIYALTVAEEQRGPRESDLRLIARSSTDALPSPAWPHVFSTRTGFDRNVNQYLKIAHQGATVIALSLPEDDVGFCDAALGPWIEPIRAYTAAEPNINFVILNRVGPAALRCIGGTMRNGLTFASRAGMSCTEAIFLARKAHAYIGPLDIFGIAARAAGQPGVYFLDEERTPTSEEHGVVYSRPLNPAETLSRLQHVVSKTALQRPYAVMSGTVSAERVRDRALTAPIVVQAPLPESSTTLENPSAAMVRSLSRAQSDTSTLPLDYSLIVPTYNRPTQLRRLTGYLERSGAQFPLLVLDSSEPALRAQNAAMLADCSLDARHVVFPQDTDPYAKMRDGVAMVGTAYCSLCADDDLIILSAVQRCVAALERDASAVLAHGYYFNFNESSSFDLSYIVYRGNSIDDRAPLARLRTLFSAYEAMLYGVYRTTVARRVFRDVEKLDTVLARELLTGAITAIAGKCLRIPEFYYGRNTAESLSYNAWHPHQILAEDPARLFSSYPMFRSFVLQAFDDFDGNQGTATPSIVDVIMLRYLQPFLREDVLDLIIDQKQRGKESKAIVSRVWDVFVRAQRSAHRTEPMIDRAGGFAPERAGAGRARDYRYESLTWDGKRREYNVFYEFLYPDFQPSPTAGKEQLAALLDSLDRY